MLDYLQGRGWMEPYEEVLRLEKPGEGNMNVVVRVVGDSRNLILKQSKPYVVKYPHVPAPIERVDVERRFYALTAPHPALRSYLPKVEGFDARNQLLALADLGAGADYTFLYKKEQTIDQSELRSAVDFLSELHGTAFTDEARLAFPGNLSMRRLNHQHIFVFPFEVDNGFNLDTIQPGLQELSMRYKTDEHLKKKVMELGEVYLSSGAALLHGDYYPGSWLKVPSGFKVIDPEFGFFGPAEYDLGVMLAHLRMAGQPAADLQNVLEMYGAQQVRYNLVRQMEGVEILRRLIGLAQLPLALSLDEKEELLQQAAASIKGAVSF